jgi:hypothetical protein
MTDKESTLFYVGAAIYLDLDSDEIDRALATRGLSIAGNSVEECRNAIREMFPQRFAAGKGAGPGQEHRRN